MLLISELRLKEVGHEVEGFGGFGELEVVPEGVGQGFEDDELRVDVGAEQGAMEDGGVAEEEITGAGDEEGGGHTLEVGVERGEDGVFAVGVAGIFVADAVIGILRFEATGETVEGEEFERV